MQRNGRRLVICTWVLALMTFLSFHALSAERKTIIGTVSDYYQIETDEGDVYDIVENSQGDRVAEQIGRRVKATGMVEDDGSLRVINIISYTIMEEENVQEEEAEQDVQEEVEENQEEEVQGEDEADTVEADTQEEAQEETVEEDTQEEVQEETVEEDTQEEAQEEAVEEDTQEEAQEGTVEEDTQEEVQEETVEENTQ